EGLLCIPFGHDMPYFREVIDVPLITAPADHPPEVVMKKLGLESDARPRVLIGMRGGLSREMLEATARSLPELLLLNWNGEPSAVDNLRALSPADGISFHDVLGISEAVVSKLGHGIITDCITGRTGILWPARTGFRE